MEEKEINLNTNTEDETASGQAGSSEQAGSGGHHSHHHHGEHTGHHHHHHHSHRKKLTPARKALIAAAAVVLIGGGAVTAGLYNQRKAAESQAAAWHAAREAAAKETAQGDSEGTAQGAGNALPEVDYAPYSSNEYSPENVINRVQPFKYKEVLYDGERYVRNTAVKPILLLGLDRTAGDLKEVRKDPWLQGQTDGIVLVAYNSARKTVRILQIPRDTMASVWLLENGGYQDVIQITMAYGTADGVYESCQKTCEAVSTLLGGVEIENYMLGDVNVINRLNDLVGGVTVTIPKDGANYKDKTLVEGETITLHGDQAEHFVRQRDRSNDYSAMVRMDHQRIYMQAFERQLAKCLKRDAGFLDKMFDSIEEDMLTDMTRAEYVNLIASVVAGGSFTDETFMTLPGKAEMGEIYMEYHPHYADIDRMVLDLFYRKADG